MSAATIIYLAEVADSICMISSFIAVASSLPMVVTFIKYFFDHDEDNESARKIAAKSKVLFFLLLPIFMLSISISVFLPSSKTIYLMAGAKVAEDVAKSPEAKEISSKIIKVLNQKLDEQLEQKK